jgi:hypothetical protein
MRAYVNVFGHFAGKLLGASPFIRSLEGIEGSGNPPGIG